MADLESQNIPFYWSNEFFKALLHEGVRHLVISPGSRSTPLALAADAHPSFEKHVILDERSAAYTALGIGKSTCIPAALICTSGTAAANYYPSVVEARQYGVPLLILTADRPPKLRDIGANQSIDQLKLYGDYPVWYHEIGEPNMKEGDLRRLRRAAAQAVYFSCERRGPSHLNFAFRKPLEPTPSFVDKTEKKNQNEVKSEIQRSFTTGSYLKNELTVFEKQLQEAERPVLIAGPEDPGYALSPWATDLVNEFNIPVLAEPGSNIKCRQQRIDGFSAFLRHSDQLSKLTPDLILRIGQDPVTKGLHHYIQEHRDINHYHLSTTSKTQDGQLATDKFYVGIPPTFSHSSFPERTDWWNAWHEAEKKFQNRYQIIFSHSSLTDGEVIHHLIDRVPDHWSLVLSNSFPVRDTALFGRLQHSSHKTFVNRGASGIDGITSTAIGISIGTADPVLLITGDLSFLHDTNGLLNASILSAPVVIGIINNGGGSIFRMLPIAAHEDSFSTYFETPQQAHISSMKETYGVNYQKWDNSADLNSLDFDPFESHPGIHLLEFATDPDLSMEERQTLWNSGQP